jgi:uncharacterized protein with GYD domain
MTILRLSSASMLLVVFMSWTSAVANPALEGYPNAAQYRQRVEKLSEPDGVKVKAIASTEGDYEVIALTVAGENPAGKPAIAIVAGLEADDLAGPEMALRLAERLVATKDEAATKKLLDELTLYIFPRVSPTATEKCFTKPSRTPRGNARRTDDDRDGQTGEDPPNDLNGDGLITLMRIQDPTGSWMPHPADGRVLIEADVKRGERGQYRMFVEGTDDDHDEQFNEDAADGVSFDSNWPHRYPSFQAGAGPNAVSEPETRAVADFLYDRNNVFAVLCFSSHDNLFHPWKPDAGKDKQRIRTTVLSADAPYLDFLAGKYRDLHGGKDAPESTWPGGTFAEWSYFQYGRWTFSARPWWIPKVPEKEGEKTEEKRGAEELNALRWLEQEKIDGFVPWQKIEHPDFPGQTVEVGGFKPLVRTTPPVKLLDELVPEYVSFLSLLAEKRPRIELQNAKAEALGGGVARVSVDVVSSGYLPTLSEMGQVTEVHQRLQVELTSAKKPVFLKGPQRVKLSRLEASAKKKVEWLIRLDAPAGDVKLRAWSPELGVVEANVRVTP